MALRYGFSRIVTARELTISEIEAVCKASNVEVEVFVHGIVLQFFWKLSFSSWVGGMSANRGLCRQPCRRVFSRQENMQTGTIFSMSDLQLVKYLPILEKIGVSSLKIEGRMKPAEYVYRVAKAYRIAVDTPERLEEAEKILEFDYARDKSEYFFGHNLKDSISSQSFVGKPAGMVSVSNDYIEVKIIR